MDAKEQNIIRCKECKHYKQSTTADRKMCFRKDIDGFSVMSLSLMIGAHMQKGKENEVD